jgi:hypothetical protein
LCIACAALAARAPHNAHVCGRVRRTWVRWVHPTVDPRRARCCLPRSHLALRLMRCTLFRTARWPGACGAGMGAWTHTMRLTTTPDVRTWPGQLLFAAQGRWQAALCVRRMRACVRSKRHRVRRTGARIEVHSLVTPAFSAVSCARVNPALAPRHARVLWLRRSANKSVCDAQTTCRPSETCAALHHLPWLSACAVFFATRLCLRRSAHVCDALAFLCGKRHGAGRACAHITKGPPDSRAPHTLCSAPHALPVAHRPTVTRETHFAPQPGRGFLFRGCPRHPPPYHATHPFLSCLSRRRTQLTMHRTLPTDLSCCAASKRTSRRPCPPKPKSCCTRRWRPSKKSSTTNCATAPWR